MRLAIAVSGLAIVAVAVIATDSASPRIAAGTELVREAPAAPVLRAAIPSRPRLPERATRTYPPGTFVPLRIPRVEHGIPCPDGTFLPPLNGVLPTDPIPPIRRESFMASIGDVTGKYTDATGCEWWITEDGSAFTTRWVEQVMPDGTRARMVRLDQADRVPDGLAVRR